MLSVAVAQSSSDGSAIRLYTSGFVDDVMFYIMGRMCQNQRRSVFRPLRQVAASGAKSVVSDYMLSSGCEERYVQKCEAYIK